MTNEITAPHKDFESIKKIDQHGLEYWEARELLPMLGYEKWEKAEEVVGRAARACINSGQDVDNHFHHTVKMVEIGGDLPEHLAPEPHIKEIKKELKQLPRKGIKTLK